MRKVGSDATFLTHHQYTGIEVKPPPQDYRVHSITLDNTTRTMFWRAGLCPESSTPSPSSGLDCIAVIKNATGDGGDDDDDDFHAAY